MSFAHWQGKSVQCLWLGWRDIGFSLFRLLEKKMLRAFFSSPHYTEPLAHIARYWVLIMQFAARQNYPRQTSEAFVGDGGGILQTK